MLGVDICDGKDCDNILVWTQPLHETKYIANENGDINHIKPPLSYCCECGIYTFNLVRRYCKDCLQYCECGMQFCPPCGDRLITTEKCPVYDEGSMTICNKTMCGHCKTSLGNKFVCIRHGKM